MDVLISRIIDAHAGSSSQTNNAELVDDGVDEAVRVELQLAITARRRRCQQLRRLVAHLEEQIVADEHMLAEMEGALGLDPQLRIEHLDSTLRGQRIREVALELLHAHLSPGESIHYRAWYSLLKGAGHRIAGKDPLATFLVQVSRAPEVEQLGGRSGLYRFRPRDIPVRQIDSLASSDRLA